MTAQKYNVKNVIFRPSKIVNFSTISSNFLIFATTITSSKIVNFVCFCPNCYYTSRFRSLLSQKRIPVFATINVYVCATLN